MDARFVVAKDIVNNVVLVSRQYYSEDKRRRAFRVGSFNWFSGSPPADTSSLQCKV
jgi:tRNA U34 2-thiouridine synthase MnmA/TrmU